MYVNITGSKNNKDVYITQSYRKSDGKTSSRIYRKLGKLNDLLASDEIGITSLAGAVIEIKVPNEGNKKLAGKYVFQSKK